MCCIVENYQEETGFRVPRVLQPFMGGVEFIPYNAKQLALFQERKDKEVDAANAAAAKK